MSDNISKKKKFHFNFIDVFLLLIILAAGTMLFFIFKPDSNAESIVTGDTTKEIVYVIEMREAREEFKGNVNIKDSVVDAVGLYPIGEVTDVTFSPAIYVYEANKEGAVYSVDYPDLINISIKVKATATVGENSYSIGGYTIAVGQCVYFRTPNLTGTAFCTSLEESPEA